MFGCEPIENRDDFGVRQVGNGDRLGERTGIRCEAPAMKVDEDAIQPYWRGWDPSASRSGRVFRRLWTKRYSPDRGRGSARSRGVALRPSALVFRPGFA